MILALLFAAGTIAIAPGARGDLAGSERQLFTLIDYISRDYAGAVGPKGAIVSESEYAEMKNFAETAQTLVQRLKPDLLPAQATYLEPKLAQLVTLVAKRADVQEIVTLTSDIKNIMLVSFAVPVAPQVRPSYALGEQVYQQHCAHCHGAQGRADGEDAVGMQPPPRNFFDGEFMAQSSPFKIYNTLYTGVQGTPMIPYAGVLSEEALWSVAFYVTSLRHSAGDQTRDPQIRWKSLAEHQRQALLNAGLSLELLASTSDRELRQWLSNRLDPTKESWDSVLRAAAAFVPDVPLNFVGGANSPEEALHWTMTQVKLAETLFTTGQTHEAESALLDAYLNGFEKVERAMTLNNHQLLVKVEQDFLQARGWAAKGQTSSFMESTQQLSFDLAQCQSLLAERPLAPAPSFWGDFLASFLIIFREGFEAFLVIAALLAMTRSLGDKTARRWVHAGWLSALVAGGVTFVLLEMVIKVSGAARESLEAATTAIAVALLFYTGFWLLSQTERSRWDHFLKHKARYALSSGNLWTMFGMAFIAVYREAAETVLFYAALASTTQHRFALGSGFVVGCAVLLALCWGIIRFNLRLPLRLFFKVTSCVMVSISVILAGKTAKELVEAGYLQPTPIHSLPAIDLLGFYPNLETIGTQLALILLALGLWLVLNQRKSKISAANTDTA